MWVSSLANLRTYSPRIDGKVLKQLSTHTRMHAHAHTHTHTHARTHTCARTHTHVRAHTHSRTDTCCAVLSCSVVSNSVRSHGLQPSRLLCPWGFSRQEYWSGLPCPPPGDLPNQGIEPRFPPLEADSLPTELSGNIYIYRYISHTLYTHIL